MFKGQRLTMGLSGYLRDHKPVLYDRGTESLWVIEGDELKSFAEDRLARYKLPDDIVVVDALPLTAMEKLDRRALAAMVTH